MTLERDHDERTVCCSVRRAVPNAQHVEDIRTGVGRVHRAAIYLSELLNVHVRQALERDGACPREVFDANQLSKAFQDVTSLHGEVREPASFLSGAFSHLPSMEREERSGITQALTYAAIGMVTCARNNVVMHFLAHVQKHVNHAMRVPDDVFKTMTEQDRRAAKLARLRVAADLCAVGDVGMSSDPSHHGWIREERRRLRIDDVLSSSRGSIRKVLKASPERFVFALFVINKEREARGASTFSLYPLRRRLSPSFVHLDERALNELLQAMRNERDGRKKKRRDADTFTFANVFDARGAGVVQGWRLKTCVDTDGVAVHFKQLRGTKERVREAREAHTERYARRARGKKRCREEEPTPPPPRARAPTSITIPSVLPRRGIWCIDALKHFSREEYTVVGVDPGVHELLHASRIDSPERSGAHVRYTLRERRKDLRVAQYACEARRHKPDQVAAGERALAACNSRSPTLDGFKRYCACRRSFLCSALSFYGILDHRHRRRKTSIKRQKSESKLVKKIASLRADPRKPIVLAYGSWGLTTSRPFKGVPPSKGIGMMRHLAKHFPVVPTPEHYTSKLCPACGEACGAHPSLRRRVKKQRDEGEVLFVNREIRGLRVCQNDACKLHLNRDRMAAHNIATNYARLVRGDPPLRVHSTQDAELNRLQCAICSEE